MYRGSSIYWRGPIPKPVAYVGIKSVDSMVAEDSGSYNFD